MSLFVQPPIIDSIKFSWGLGPVQVRRRFELPMLFATMAMSCPAQKENPLIYGAALVGSLRYRAHERAGVESSAWKLIAFL